MLFVSFQRTDYFLHFYIRYLTYVLLSSLLKMTVVIDNESNLAFKNLFEHIPLEGS